MNAYILTESSTKVGLGHLIRCIAIYESFLKINVDCEFVLKLDDPATKLISQFYSKLVYMEFDWINSIFDDFNNNFKSNLIIFDSYNINNDLLSKYRLFAQTTSIIDDANRLSYFVDIIINPNLFGSEINYSNQNVAKTFFIGGEFLLLRKEICDKKPLPIKQEVKTIFISFGGGINEILYKIVNLICSYFEYKIVLPIGLGMNPKKLLKNDNIEILNPTSIQELIDRYNESDIAILNGGQTLNEFLALQIPCIVIQTAENQQNNINYLRNTNCIKFAGESHSLDIENKIISLIKELNKYEIRQTLRNYLKNLIRKDGSLALVKRFQEILKD